MLGGGGVPSEEGSNPTGAAGILLPPGLEGLEGPRQQEAVLVEVGDQAVELVALLGGKRFRRERLRFGVRVRERERVRRLRVVARRRRERVLERRGCRHAAATGEVHRGGGEERGRAGRRGTQGEKERTECSRALFECTVYADSAGNERNRGRLGRRHSGRSLSLRTAICATPSSVQMARSSSHESHLDAASDPDHERDALARLERLLEAQLAPDSASPYGLTAQANDAPPRKKKKQEDETKRSVSEAATGEEVGQSVPIAASQPPGTDAYLRATCSLPPLQHAAGTAARRDPRRIDSTSRRRRSPDQVRSFPFSRPHVRRFALTTTNSPPLLV